MDNRTVADKLTTHAHTLEAGHRNLYRVKAYRQAAETILGLDEPVEAIVARTGRKGLRSLPGIGAHLSLAIESLVRTGEFRTLNKNRASGSAAALKQSG